jgi:hypothetical protein
MCTTKLYDLYKSIIAHKYGTKPDMSLKEIRRAYLVDWAKQHLNGN